MSADKYLECPICHGLPEKLRDGYEKFYGVVTVAEYEKLKEEYEGQDKPYVPVYCEIFLNADGTVSLELGAECETCHAKWKHKGVVK